MSDKPYLSTISQPAGEIEVITLTNGTWDYGIKMGRAAYLYLNANDLADLAHVIVKRLYDDNALPMPMAEHVNYLTHVVLQDPREALEAAMMEAGE